MGEHIMCVVYCDGQYILDCGVTGRPGVEYGDVWAETDFGSESRGGDADDETGVNRDESHAAERLKDET
jgi:hypothetical protein